MYIDVPWGLVLLQWGLRRNAWLNSRASASELGTRRNSYDWGRLSQPCRISEPWCIGQGLAQAARSIHNSSSKISSRLCVKQTHVFAKYLEVIDKAHRLLHCFVPASFKWGPHSCELQSLKQMSWVEIASMIFSNKGYGVLGNQTTVSTTPKVYSAEAFADETGAPSLLPESFHCRCLWWYFRTLAKSRSFIILYIYICIYIYIYIHIIYSWPMVHKHLYALHRPTHFMLFGWGIAPGSFGVGIKLPPQVRTICLAGASGS